MTEKTNLIYIGTINRHGGTLLSRLFDGHKDISSYPLETQFPKDESVFNFIDHLNGTPTKVPSFKDFLVSKDICKFLKISENQPKPIHKWRKEKSDPVGVRKNYLEKAFYQNFKTDFDYGKYIDILKKKSQNVHSINDIYAALHDAYFDSWDNGVHKGSGKYVLMQTSGGLFLKNFEDFFTEFDSSYFVSTVRDVKTYIASEKTRLARIFFGARRFQKPNVPNFLVKKFKNYDLDTLIRSWLTTITRLAILQENYSSTGRFLVYSYENLVKETKNVMLDFSSVLKIEYQDILIKPTLAGKDWFGNSHHGKQKGINLSNYYSEVLDKSELDRIDSLTANISEALKQQKKTFLDLSLLPKDIFFDYKLQKKLSASQDNWAIYSAFAFRGYRSVRVKKSSFLSIIAYFFSIFIYLINIPRLIKLRLFPGLGKQNYT